MTAERYIAAAKALPECFACGRKIIASRVVRVRGESTIVYVGPECAAKVATAGADGYQPSRGGPKLVSIEAQEQSP